MKFPRLIHSCWVCRRTREIQCFVWHTEAMATCMGRCTDELNARLGRRRALEGKR